MKGNIIFILYILFLINCSSKQSDIKKMEKNDSFSSFLSEFDSLQLDFKVIGLDFVRFSDKNIDENTQLILNPLLKPIEGLNLEFLKMKYPIDNPNRYFGIYKRKIGEHYLAILKQSNDEKEEYWLKLNLFDLKGELLDTLTFAGQKVYFCNKYGKIEQDFHISIYTYEVMQPDTVNAQNYYATESINEYTISSKGQFILIKSRKDRACFTDIGENNIVTRVDTTIGKNKLP